MTTPSSQPIRNIVVTGVSSGIGKTICKILIEKGYRVFGSVRKAEDAKELTDAFPDMFEPMIFDVCDRAAILSEGNRVSAIVGNDGIAGLVNNAGLAVFGPIELLDDMAFDHIMNVNVTGTRSVTNAFLPALRLGRDHFGKTRIINVSSLSGIFNTPMNGGYCISKHAMESLGEIYRRELLPENIDVVSIRSGPIATEIWRKNLEKKVPFSDTRYKNMAIKSHRIMQYAKKSALPPSVIAELVLDILAGRKKGLSYHCGKGRNIARIFASSLMPKRLADRLIVKALNKPAKETS